MTTERDAKENNKAGDSRKKSVSAGVICAVLGAVSWGFSGTCSQYMFMNYEVDSVWLTTMRMTISGIVLFIISFIAERKELFEILRRKRDMINEAIFGIAGLLFCQFSYLTAIQYSNSATATVLQNLSVVFIAVFTAVITRTMLGKKQIFSIALALFGVFLIATHGNIRSMVISGKGLFWGLCTAVGVVVYSMLSARLAARWSSRIVSAYGMLIGGFTLGILTGSYSLRPELDPAGIAVMAMIVLIGTVGAFTLFIEGINKIGAVRATLIGCLEPVSATVISAIWLKSTFSITDILGFVCIIATVLIFNINKRSAE